MNTRLASFEPRLLHELRAQVASTPAPAPRRHRRLAGGLVVAATAALAGVILVPGLGAGPAYSVQEGNAGEVEVEVHRLEDAAGLEAALADHGIAADIRYLPWGQACAPGRYQAVDRRIPGMTASIGSDLLRIVLPPGAVREGETFVMWVSGREMTAAELADRGAEEGVQVLDGHRSRVEFDVAAGPVAPCDVVPAAD